MAIVKKDILDKKFNRSKKGYDEFEVDQFLDLVAAEVDNLIKEKEEAVKLLDEYRASENNLKEVLLIAQRTANNLVDDAKVKADEIIESAKAEAGQSRVKLEAETYEMRQLYESEKAEFEDKIRRMHEFFTAYREHVVMDMENQQKAFKEIFMSESTFADIDSEFGVSELAEEPIVEVAPAEEKKELNTDTIEHIDISEIVSKLPGADEELKALIDEIM